MSSLPGIPVASLETSRQPRRPSRSFSDEGAHVDLNEAAKHRHGCLEVGHHLDTI